MHPSQISAMRYWLVFDSAYRHAVQIGIGVGAYSGAMEMKKIDFSRTFGSVVFGFSMACATFFDGVVLAEESVEKELKVHRLVTTETAPYDAFTYLNRIGTAVEDGETPQDFAGRMFGRLANQEGRVELKLPPGFTPLAYDGLKIFYQYTGEPKTGNCVSCHEPPHFTDMSSHVVDASKEARETPTLRDIGNTAPYLSGGKAKTLAAVLKQKMRAAKLAKDDSTSDIDEAYTLMTITNDDIPALVEFLKTMDDLGKEGFRDLILNAEILDTAAMVEGGL